MHGYYLVIVKSPKRGWKPTGDLTNNFAPWVGNLTPQFVKSPVVPHPPRGKGWGIKLTAVLPYGIPAFFFCGCANVVELFTLIIIVTANCRQL